MTAAMLFPATLRPGLVVEGFHLGAVFSRGPVREVLPGRPGEVSLVILENGQMFSSAAVRPVA